VERLRLTTGDVLNVTGTDGKELFTNFIQENNYHTPREIRENILQESFKNIDSEMFGILYKDINSILWKIEDRNTYKSMCENEELDGKIEFISVSGSPTWFLAIFKFKSGAIIEEYEKLKISSFTR